MVLTYTVNIKKDWLKTISEGAFSSSSHSTKAADTLNGTRQKYICFCRSRWWKKIFFFFFHFLRLLSCFNPILTLSNNCYLLIIFTIEGWIVLLHNSMTVFHVTVLYALHMKCKWFLIKCFGFLILLVLAA